MPRSRRLGPLVEAALGVLVVLAWVAVVLRIDAIADQPPGAGVSSAGQAGATTPDVSTRSSTSAPVARNTTPG